MKRLSSNYLFHYKSEPRIVKLILENGFQHRMWDEKVIFRDSKQQNFVVCFCDILAEQASYHRQCYGNISIVLTKEWGIKNNITPLRYVHSNSTGQFADYIKIKNINREIREKNVVTNQHHQYAIEYLCMGLAKDSRQVLHPSLAQSKIANPNWDKFLSEFDKEFDEMEIELKKTGKEKILYKYFHHLGNRLLELHNELEKRDALMRVYQEDFDCPTGKKISEKILYDEREWRSVKFIGDQDYQSNPQVYNDALTNRYLPESYNLKFSSNDFVAILVDTDTEMTEFRNFIQNNKTLLDYHIDKDKIMLYKNFKE